tara:strand:+ start:29532 stop:30821 length:1290 start_codon:yes stop_codon:yes gene_type:complete
MKDLNMLETYVVNFLEKQLKTIDSQFVLGFSGGVDSTVLAYIMQKNDIPFVAVYVNHGLSENAIEWENFCSNFCDKYNIPFESHKVLVKKDSRESLEDNARKKRYGIYKKVSDKYNNAPIILGHHSDDLVEAMLMNLLNHSGLSGLSTMPSDYYNEEFKLNILRPLLSEEVSLRNEQITKDALEDYALKNKIKHIYDESNADTKYTRNFLRHEIIPKLKERFGNINKPMAKTNLEAQQIYKTVKTVNVFNKLKKDFYKIDTKSLSKLTNVEKSKSLNYSFSEIGLSVNSNFVNQFIVDIDNIKDKSDVNYKQSISNYTIFYHRNEFYITHNDYLNISENSEKRIYNRSNIKTKGNSVGKLFRKNEYIRKSIPIIIKENIPLKVDKEGYITHIYNYTLGDNYKESFKLNLIKNKKDYIFYNPVIEYFLEK